MAQRRVQVVFRGFQSEHTLPFFVECPPQCAGKLPGESLGERCILPVVLFQHALIGGNRAWDMSPDVDWIIGRLIPGECQGPIKK